MREAKLMKLAKGKIPLRSMFLSILVSHLICISANAQEPNPDVTPCTVMSYQLQMNPGHSYLRFMLNTVNPALNTFDNVIRQDPAYIAKNYKQLQLDLIAKQAGVAIRLASNTY